MRNKCIDTLKGISCILVIFIHHPFPGEFGEIVKAFARIAVPMFFMVSGYFFGLCPVETQRKRGMQMVIRNFRLLIAGFLFSELFVIWRHRSFVAALKTQFTFDSICKLMLYNNTGEMYHLWFLCALIYCVILFSLLCKRITKHKCFIYIFFGLILLNIFLGIGLQDIPYFDKTILRSWLFTGLPFFGIGYLFQCINMWIFHKCRLLIFIGCILTLIEYRIFGGMDIYVGTVVLVVGLFAFAICNPNYKVSSLITKIGEEYSMLIYLLHWGVLHIEYKIISIYKLNEIYGGLYMYLSPICVLIYTTIASIIIQRLFLTTKQCRRGD